MLPRREAGKSTFLASNSIPLECEISEIAQIFYPFSTRPDLIIFLNGHACIIGTRCGWSNAILHCDDGCVAVITNNMVWSFDFFVPLQMRTATTTTLVPGPAVEEQLDYEFIPNCTIPSSLQWHRRDNGFWWIFCSLLTKCCAVVFHGVLSPSESCQLSPIFSSLSLSGTVPSSVSICCRT